MNEHCCCFRVSSGIPSTSRSGVVLSSVSHFWKPWSNTRTRFGSIISPLLFNQMPLGLYMLFLRTSTKVLNGHYERLRCQALFTVDRFNPYADFSAREKNEECLASLTCEQLTGFKFGLNQGKYKTNILWGWLTSFHWVHYKLCYVSMGAFGWLIILVVIAL